MSDLVIFLTRNKLHTPDKATHGHIIKNLSAILELNPKMPKIPYIKLPGPNKRQGIKLILPKPNEFQIKKFGISLKLLENWNL